MMGGTVCNVELTLKKLIVGSLVTSKAKIPSRILRLRWWRAEDEARDHRLGFYLERELAHAALGLFGHSDFSFFSLFYCCKFGELLLVRSSPGLKFAAQRLVVFQDHGVSTAHPTTLIKLRRPRWHAPVYQGIVGTSLMGLCMVHFV
jgi:hypothetical protein